MSGSYALSVSSSPQNFLKTLPSFKHAAILFLGPTVSCAFLLSWPRISSFIVIGCNVMASSTKGTSTKTIDSGIVVGSALSIKLP
ncbi:hypothetical protein MtrunA17_Chr4g0009111 [Medicago truncatula]|uniref:Transmembrane protein n=1 Tax=Medicago truncatula TaxID=3880 RepID=A0A396I2T1_MEDTR|nr:hypothetical protein MtrunA17_Chr4g0009111 [Medicago truncatula]